MTLQDFLNSSKPHTIHNEHPPNTPEARYDWESKLLYSVNERLNNNCTVLDYGCGGVGTLRYNLFDRFPTANYIGLDIRNFINGSDKQVYLGHIRELAQHLPKASCMTAGSIFTHLSWEEIESVLETTAPYYENGFQFGFTAFLGTEYYLHGPNHYGPNTYHITALTKQMFEDFCNKHNLELVVHDYVQMLDHKLPVQNLTHQDFITIKKKNG